jgi:hypothetical protein
MDDERRKRIRERVQLSLPVQIYSRESLDYDWKEMTRLVDVTPFGAGLTVRHPTETGRLVLLTMNLPRQLRCYDHIEEQYKVWGVVRHISLNLLEQTENEEAKYRMGVAFMGKQSPVSYQVDPTKRYEIAPSRTENGLWVLVEPQTKSILRPEDSRRETRYTIQVNVQVETTDLEGNVASREDTVTENISRHGASIFTSLNVERGRFVRVKNLDKDDNAIAVVRGKRRGGDGITRLHLEFVDNEWKIEGVD